ncbi:MAG: response regulator [Candidatus Omnitrophica bacterium]|nr:response regulator [Candidatus Omnitrophota bacterium]MDD5652538.1 response regulator [Candidatus Omnitrophota bacterium]
MAYKILVVDDDKDIVDSLHSKLTREGYQVVSAFDGEEALVRVKEDNPDVILLDLMLPKLNGFDVLKETRERFKDKWRPIIIISANLELDALKKCYDMEADHYLTKPVTMEKILQGIETMISLIPLRNN